MTNPCALVISVFLRPVHTRRRRCVQQLVSPLLVVPTELTHTEAYGLKVLESTERIDAARHTTEVTELIACVASPPSATSEHSPLTSITR